MVSSTASTRAPIRHRVKAYGPSHPKSIEWSKNGAIIAAAMRKLPTFFASAISRAPTDYSTCLFLFVAARGDAALALASFSMIVWVVTRGLA